MSKTRHLRLGECGKLDIAVTLSISDNFKNISDEAGPNSHFNVVSLP